MLNGTKAMICIEMLVVVLCFQKLVDIATFVGKHKIMRKF